MTKPRLLRDLGGTFALCYVSAAIAIIWLSVLIAPSTTMAEALVAVTPVPTPCPKTGPIQGEGPFQDATGTIKSINGLTLQITPKIPGPPINATYSSTTRITEQTLITTPPASVLLKGVDVSVQAIQNPNGTLSATSITIMQNDQPPGNQTPSNQPDIRDCFRGGGGGNLRPKLTPSGLNNKLTSNQLPSPLPGNQPDSGGCFADRGPIQKPALGTPIPIPNTQSNKQTNCREISGTVDLLQGTTLTITDRRGTTHALTLTTGPNATKIIKTTPATSMALKVGTSVLVTGLAIKGVIAASWITILPATSTAIFAQTN